MKVEDLILVSVDDHAIEPPNAFARHMPARFKGREPHVVKRGERDVWVFEAVSYTHLCTATSARSGWTAKAASISKLEMFSPRRRR